jgi:hypothetical protein
MMMVDAWGLLMKLTKAFLVCLLLANSACTLRVGPDGSRTYGLDVPVIQKVAEIVIEQKAAEIVVDQEGDK